MGSTKMTHAMVGLQKMPKDGSWWLVFATKDGAGLPDGVQVSDAVACKIRELIRQLCPASTQADS